MIVILTSFVIAFVFYPLYKKLLSKTKKENFSAFIVSFLIILIIAVPTFFLINVITKEATSIYSDLSIKLTEDKELLGIECKTDNTLCKALDGVNNDPKIRFYVSGAITNLASSITRKTSDILFSLPRKIIELLIIFLLVFFLFKAGKLIWDKSKDLLPLKTDHKDRLLKKFSNTIHGVVYGYLVIALIEGIIGWIAFALIGSKIALLFGIIIGIMGLIPMIGAPIVWIPASIIYFFSGGPLQAVILIIAGVIIMIMDIWVRSEVIGKRTDIHPAIVALGVLGGIVTFGPVGVVIGPLILSLLITSIEIFQTEKDFYFN